MRKAVKMVDVYGKEVHDRFLKREIGKKIVYWPIEDAEKKAQRKLVGTIVDRDEDDPCFAKVFTGKKTVDVHIGQMLNIF